MHNLLAYTYIVGAFVQIRMATISFVMTICPSVSMEQLHFPWKGFHESDNCVFLENMSKIFKFHYSLPTISGTVREAVNTFVVTSRYLLLRFTNIIPYPTAFPYGNGMVLHFYQQQESSTTKTVHKVINKGLKTYV